MISYQYGIIMAYQYDINLCGLWSRLLPLHLYTVADQKYYPCMLVNHHWTRNIGYIVLLTRVWSHTDIDIDIDTYIFIATLVNMIFHVYTMYNKQDSQEFGVGAGMRFS